MGAVYSNNTVSIPSCPPIELTPVNSLINARYARASSPRFTAASRREPSLACQYHITSGPTVGICFQPQRAPGPRFTAASRRDSKPAQEASIMLADLLGFLGALSVLHLRDSMDVMLNVLKRRRAATLSSQCLPAGPSAN